MKKINLLFTCFLAMGIAFAQSPKDAIGRETQYETLRKTTVKQTEQKQEKAEQAEITPEAYFNIDDYRPSAKNPAPKTMKAPITKDFHILDSIVIVDGNGNNSQKMEYFFNEKYWFVKIVQSLWNLDEARWDLLNETSLEWETRGEVGYLKTQIVAWNEGSTEKTEWTYNEQNLGDSEIRSRLPFGEANWQYESKKLYGYTGSFPNPTHLEMYEHDEANWFKVAEENCAFDQWGRQTSFERYSFAGSTQTGDEKETKTYLPFDGYNDYMTEQLLWVWLDGNWAQSGRHTYGWTEVDEYGARHAIYDSNLVINPETGEVGCYTFGWFDESCSNVTIFSWDGGKQQAEQYYVYDNTAGEYIAQIGYNFTWSKNANDEWQAIRVGSWANTGERTDSTIWVFSVDKPTYHYSDYFFTFYQYWKHEEGNYKPIEEESRVFDNRGNETEWYIYKYDDAGVKLPTGKHLFSYDENNNLLGSQNWQIVTIYDWENVDPETWEPATTDTFVFYSTTEFIWQNNVLVRKAIYFEPFVTLTSGNSSNGKGYSYDLNVSSDDVYAMNYEEDDLTFGKYRYPHKLLFKYDLEDEGVGLDTSYKYVYYYTVIQVEVEPTSVEKLPENQLKVYPNPVKDILSIESEFSVKQVVVLDMQGRVVLQLQGDCRKIDMGTFSKGNYVVRVKTDKGVSTAKIVKQ